MLVGVSQITRSIAVTVQSKVVVRKTRRTTNVGFEVAVLAEAPNSDVGQGFRAASERQPGWQVGF